VKLFVDERKVCVEHLWFGPQAAGLQTYANLQLDTRVPRSRFTLIAGGERLPVNAAFFRRVDLRQLDALVVEEDLHVVE
jgi:hypothetical protein